MEAGDGKVEGRWVDGNPVPPLPRLEFDDLIGRLSDRKHAFTRYQLLDEIGRGGMGRVLRVHDVDLHRELAMKVLRQDDVAILDPATSSNRLQMHARFLEEAQVASQLDHPGIVPVHDIGLDAEGRIYFTMKLVRGRTLGQVIGLAEQGAEGWSLTRVLNVLLRVCEAMGYAHERGVLHRDLKPGNVMVGGHGEVYVMDWGLARLVDRPDLHVRSGETEHDGLRSARRGTGDSEALSAFLTEDGRVLGTPAYMSPEQASGNADLVTAQSDVYGVGAMLYEVLTGVAPYSTPKGERPDNRAVWMRLQMGPPKRVPELRRDVPPELVAICEKAMERDPTRRYASMTELAEDLRAYLEVRVVRAYRSGPFTELKKWIGRNRTAAVLLLALAIVVLGSGFIGAWQERVRVRALALRADAHTAATLVERVDQLWPIAPEKAAAMQSWLQEARAFVAESAGREAELQAATQAALEQGRASWEPAQKDPVVENEVARAEKLARDMRDMRTSSFSEARQPKDPGVKLDEWRQAREILSSEADWWSSHAALLRESSPPERVLRFERPDESEAYSTLASLVDHRSRVLGLLPAMDLRSRLTSELRSKTIDEEASAWSTAIRSIADSAECPRYGGLAIRPQIGLIPLRRDPRSGLWEFWHVLSGARPESGPDDRFRITADTGLVLVLIPGGRCLAGAQDKDKAGTRYDPDAHSTERLREADLAPYFLSKYELTQGQWCRLAGTMPSTYYAGTKLEDSPRVTRAHPVENVDWYEATKTLARFGLALPTEMQWEWAARAGSDARYGTSDDFSAIEGQVSFADAAFSRFRNLNPSPTKIEDGSRIHLPVDSFGPNGFGLYCILGNVSELCLDAYADSETKIVLVPGTGENTAGQFEKRTARGGSYRDAAVFLRITARRFEFTDRGSEVTGLRPLRPLDL